MSETVKMPALGESVTEGTVTRWLKNVGDKVAVDEPLLEVSTDKVDTEVPSPVEGVLEEILVQEDETVEVGADMCRIGDGSGGGQGGEAPAQEAAPAAEAEQEEEPAPQEEAPQEEAPQEAAPQEAAPEQAAPQQPSGGEATGGEKVTMPALGESVTEGTVTRWLKAEGDDVAVDEPLLEVSTDKVDTEVPSPVAGKLTKILVAEDETVEVGADLCVIGGSGGDAAPAAPARSADEPGLADEKKMQDEAAAESQAKTGQDDDGPQDEPAAPQQQPTPEQAAPSAPAPQQQAPQQPVPSAPATAAPAAEDTSAYVTPLVRKLAQENGVDLASVKGTGIGGRIRKQDVLEAAGSAKPAAAQQQTAPAPAQTPAAQQPQAAPQAPAPQRQQAPASPAVGKRGTTEKMTRLRQVIADRMVSSLQTAAQLTTVVEVDVTRIARLRGRVKDEFAAREGVKLTFLPFMAQATIEALKQFPELNASIDGTEVTYHAQENLGIAVDTERGLLVPVIKDAGDLNIAGLARKIADLADRTRSNQVTPDELGGATFTITNIGSAGAILDTPIINQPNVAILGTGAVVKRPVVVTDEDGQETIAVRSMCYLVLTYDHRLVDGANAARFLSAIKARLEEGSFEV